MTATLTGPPASGASAPVVEPSPDLAERWEQRTERGRAKRPRLTAFLRLVALVWLVVAIPVLVLALIFVPNAARALPVVLGTVWFLVQAGLLARSKTLRLLTIGRFCSLGAALAVPVGLLSVLIGSLVGWTPQDDQASVFIAGPIEEPLKLLPLVLFGAVAWNRIRRFSAADFLLAGAAAGAGFNLAEDLMRRVATAPGIAGVLVSEGDEYGLNYGPVTLFPGWWGADQGIGFAGHGVTTALVGAGIGIAVVHRGRRGWRWIVPVVLLGWVTVGHMVNNDYAGLGSKDQLPEALVEAWVALGGGQLDRYLLLVLAGVVVLVDYRAMRRVAGQVPALPQRLPPGHAHPGLRPQLPPPPERFTHEIRTFAAALRRGAGTFVFALMVAREQRELTIGEYRARGRPRRHTVLRQRILENTGRLAVLLSGAALAAGLLTAVAGTVGVSAGGQPDPVFLAWLFDSIVAWWTGMSTVEQLLTILSVLSLFTGGGLLVTGLLGRALIPFLMRQMFLGGARGRVATRIAQYLSRFANRRIVFDPKQVQAKFKHAKDFNFPGNWKKGAGEQFQKLLEAHVRDPSTIVRQGTWKGRPVTHFYNPETGINVIRGADGKFISGWKLKPFDVERLLRTGRLGMEPN